MCGYKHYIKLIIFALVVVSSSVFLSNITASAQEAPLPLIENQKIIQEKSEAVAEKSTMIQSTAKEIQSLEQKKQTLAEKLDAIKQETIDLKNKLAEKKATAEAEKKRVEELRNMFVHVTYYASNSAGNLYTPGNCTFYAKSRRPDLPNNLGNANTWYYNAAAQGWNVGFTPKKGAIATSTTGWLGHVAYVEGVSLDGQWVVISEMNYGGLYRMNTRTVHYTEFNYIYELN